MGPNCNFGFPDCQLLLENNGFVIRPTERDGEPNYAVSGETKRDNLRQAQWQKTAKTLPIHIRQTSQKNLSWSRTFRMFNLDKTPNIINTNQVKNHVCLVNCSNFALHSPGNCHVVKYVCGHHRNMLQSHSFYGDLAIYQPLTRSCSLLMEIVPCAREKKTLVSIPITVDGFSLQYML